MLRHVDLCSGIGGFALGFEWAELSRPVLFCDIEPWSRKVLRKHWPDVPIAEDVKELANDPDGLVPDCDILTAGYPCQPFSVASPNRRGTKDDRHIWPEIFTIIKRKRPTFCVFENVYGHISMGIDEVLSDLERENYATRPFVIPAVACDAPHRRDRVWIISRIVENTRYRTGRHKWVAETGQDPSRKWAAHTNQASGSGKQFETMADTQSVRTRKYRHASKTEGFTESSATQPHGSSADVADTSGQRLQGSKRLRENEKEVGERRESANGSASQRSNDGRGQANLWLPEPPVGRVAHGIPRRVDRLRGLGNAIVPQIAQRIGETIKNSI
tara:strand:- start:255 stop:1244 length:990 start_codon:yes stop_codon:yes gene_type:complete